MKREMTDDERDAAEKIFLELVGFTVEQAKFILKTVALQIEDKAVIEDGE